MLHGVGANPFDLTQAGQRIPAYREAKLSAPLIEAISFGECSKVRHRDIANYSEVIRVWPRTNLKGQSAPSRMSLQSRRPALSLEKRPKVHTESTKVPLINEAVSCAAKPVALNGIPQVLHSWDPNFAGIY
jgi:hypothetical protein